MDSFQETWSYNEKSYKSIFSNINELRKAKCLCDVVLRVDSQHFYAHRIILAACSEYFCAMFTNKMLERELDVIELKGLSAQTMQTLLECIYTERIVFTNDNVQEILSAASLLQLVDIQVACGEFLQNKLDPTNCLGIRQFAETHGCISLKSAAQEYLCENFSTVIQHEEFLQLKFSELEDICKSDEIEVPNEEVIYNAVLSWLKYNEDERSKYLSQLIGHIRFPLLSPKFLTDVCDKETLIKRSFECRDLLDEAKKFYLRPDCRSEMTGARFKPRNEKDEHLVMLGGFGFNQKPLDTVEMFSPRLEQWSSLPQLTKRRRYAASAAIGKRLYIIGGYDTKARLKSVERLDMTHDNPVWETVAPMSFRRALPAVCVYDGKIYVCGGFDGASRHSTMEFYNEDTDTWTLLDSTSVSREGAGLVSLGQSLYCIGGYDGVDLLRSVEKYDFNVGQWSMIAPMLTPRSGAGCAALYNHHIYVCGGYDGRFHLSTVESYSIITGQWTNMSSLTVSRCYCTAASLNGKIVVCGGYDGKSLLSSLEEYEEASDKWTIKSNMPTARCDSGFAVIKYKKSQIGASSC